MAECKPEQSRANCSSKQTEGRPVAAEIQQDAASVPFRPPFAFASGSELQEQDGRAARCAGSCATAIEGLRPRTDGILNTVLFIMRHPHAPCCTAAMRNRRLTVPAACKLCRIKSPRSRQAELEPSFAFTGGNQDTGLHPEGGAGHERADAAHPGAAGCAQCHLVPLLQNCQV